MSIEDHVICCESHKDTCVGIRERQTWTCLVLSDEVCGEGSLSFIRQNIELEHQSHFVLRTHGQNANAGRSGSDSYASGAVDSSPSDGRTVGRARYAI